MRTAVICLLLIGIVLLGYVAPQFLQLRNRIELRRRCRRAAAVALTYDDGPSAELTPRLLDLLAARGARATFFMLGSRVESEPTVADRVRMDGHQIGSHSARHLHAWAVWPWLAYADVVSGIKVLSRVGHVPGLFRPPYGKLTGATYVAAKSRGARVVWWTIDSGDTHEVPPDPDDVAESVVRAGGGVVLLHDFDRAPERTHHVLRCTERILDLAEAHGLRVVLLSELLDG